MIEIRNATQEDLDFVKLNPLEGAVKNYPPLCLQGWCKAGVVNGEVIGVGGVVEFWPGVGEIWIILTNKVDGFKVETYRCIRRMVNEGFEDLKLKRAQAVVRVDYPKAIEMVIHLGFIIEGKMRKYLPDGTDAYMFSRVVAND